MFTYSDSHLPNSAAQPAPKTTLGKKNYIAWKSQTIIDSAKKPHFII